MQILPNQILFPPRTVLRPGCISELPAVTRAFGARVLLIHGRSAERSGLRDRIESAYGPDEQVRTWTYTGFEPTLDEVEAALAYARESRPDCVVAVGGGSVMDLAKSCAGLVDAPLAAADYHRGEPLYESRVPFVAVPTTAGTGSEATMVSVLTDSSLGIKKSIRHPSHLARAVLLDPELLAGCPAPVLAASGMDAFTQAVESFVSTGATWFSDQLALQAAVMIADSLPEVVSGSHGAHAEALLQGSFMAGLALSHARLGLVHGLAHPLGVRYKAAHGLVCAVCLPAVIDFNREAAFDKYDYLSEALGEDVLDLACRLLDQLGLSSPFTGHALQDETAIIEETLASGSTGANPRPVEADDVGKILRILFED